MKSFLKKFVALILKLESQLVLAKYKPKIIAITGSVGKTSTKDAIYAVFSPVAYVRKSEKSYNSEIGLPLTILGIPNGWNNPLVWGKNILKGLWLWIAPHRYPEWLILEVGVGKPGDMHRTAAWLKTDVVIITAIGETPVHIEFFSSRKHLIEEKGELIGTLKPDGILVLNVDDEAVSEMKVKTKRKTITYGFREGADVLGSGIGIFYAVSGELGGIIFRIDTEGNSLPVVLEGVFGKNHVYASLSALALALVLKLNVLEAINALKNYDIPPGRMRLLKGINSSTIIDDTYNSSPSACRSALETLGEIKSNGRKIAVLGDMLELGKHTKEAHKNIGRIAKNESDILIVVGPRAKNIKEGAVEAGMELAKIFEFLDSREAGDFIKTFIQRGPPAPPASSLQRAGWDSGGRAGDLVLVKGSQGMRMEKIVETILLDKENKNKLLVRQDREWQKK